METKELVPIPGNSKITAFYKQLVQFEQEGIEYYFTGESDKKYKVKDLLGTILGERTINEEEILHYLEKAIAAAKDTKGSSVKHLNDTFVLQPNVFGVGLNLTKIFDKLLSRQKGKGKKK